MPINEYKEITVPISAPEGYTRLDYIENTNGAHIDTGYYPTPNIDIEITYSWNSLTTQQRLFGNGDDNSNSSFILENYINSGGKMAYAYNNDTGNWVSTGVTAVTNQKVTIRINGYIKRYYLRNMATNLEIKALPLNGTATKNATTTLWLFDANRNNGQVASQTPGNFKFYGCIIYESGVLVKNYIPVKRNSDNKPGLYELVNNQFCTDPNNIDFVAGNVITESNVNIIKDSNNTIIWANNTAFPYRRLEYIHFAGNDEYINTPVLIKSGFYRSYDFDIERNNTRQSTLCCYDGTANSNLRRFYVYDMQTGTNGCRACIGNTWSTSQPTYSNIPLNTRLNAALVSSTVSSKPRLGFNLTNRVTGTKIINTTTINGTTNGSLTSLSLYLMACHTIQAGGTEILENPTKGKVYYFEERNTNYQGNLTHQQYPAQRKSDGKCGLYDVITGQFFEMQGTETTTTAAGPVVDEYWNMTASS